MTLLDRGEVGIIKVLAEKSLIDIATDGRIAMYCSLEEMGRQIVRQDSFHYPAQQQIYYDIYPLLADNGGTTRTEGVMLDASEMPSDFTIEWKLFKPMENLNFLKIYNYKHRAGSHCSLKGSLQLPCQLRLLHLDAYLFTTLHPIVQPDCLVELNLCYSKLKTLWSGTTPRLSHLKRLILTGSKDLKELPGLQEAVHLEVLLLQGCVSLTRIPKSICSLPKLQKLDLSNCGGLKNVRIIIREYEDTIFRGRIVGVRSACMDFLDDAEPLVNEPRGISLTDLTVMGNIDIKLKVLEGYVEHLCFVTEQLVMLEQQTATPPYGFKSLDVMRFSCDNGSGSFKCCSLLDFPWLKELNLINLSIEEIPDDIHHMQVLEKLDLSGNDFIVLPASMMLLSKLKHVTLCSCRKLVALLGLYQLETLKLSDCTQLRALVKANLTQAEEGDDGRYSLLEIWLDNCNNTDSLSDELSHFTKLTYLDISMHDFETVPPSIKDLSSLVTLCINHCNALKSLTELPLSLKYLYAHGCMSLDANSFSTNQFDHHDLSPCFQHDLAYSQITRFPYRRRGEEAPVCFCFQKSKRLGVYNQGTRSLRSTLIHRSNSKTVKLVALVMFTGVFVWFRLRAIATK